MVESQLYFSNGLSRGLRRNVYDLFPRYTPNPEYYRKFPQVDTPIMILHGLLDPQTPFFMAPYYLNKIKRNDFQFIVEFPNEVHGIISKGECPLNLIANFLKNPRSRIDQSCINNMPKIDWEGTTEVVKKLSKTYFGVDNMWQGI